jgi:type VI secretion system protein ImpG
VLLAQRDTEQHVVADRTRPMDFEVHSVTGVIGHGGAQRQRFSPFYAVGPRAVGDAGRCWYATSRKPRHVSGAQRRKGMRSGYLGSETWISLVDAREEPFEGDVRELSIDTLCTNRDLPFLMPVGGNEDFSLEAAAPLAGIRCIQGPTRPLAPHDEGEAHWRLINLLSLNTLSLIDDDGAAGAAALRDLMGIHADTLQSSVARQIDGVRAVTRRPVHRRVPSPGPIAFGRGIEITLECDDAAFEGRGAFLLGAVLEQFFARYVSINSFTETVLRSTRRGELMRWPTRLGRRHAC